MRSIDELTRVADPAIDLIRDWVAGSEHSCELLPPSVRRTEILESLQVTTRSPLGALAFETGGLLVQGGWLRFLGSGHARFARDLLSWNEGRADGFLLVADDVTGGFFAINGGGLGADVQSVYYAAPDDPEWLSLEIGFTDFLRWSLSERLDEFYRQLRWASWEAEIGSVGADECFSYYPFLWTAEGSIEASGRAVVPISEAYDLRSEVIRRRGTGVSRRTSGGEETP